MPVRFPSLPRLGLGLGLDLPWAAARGFRADVARGDRLAAATRSFLRRESRAWSHAFFSWQPRDRGAVDIEHYKPAWDDLCAALPPSLPRALHHTALNLGALAPSDRRALLTFTDALCTRYQLRWVNEDVGLWSLAGRPLPYPLPPLLTDEGLGSTIANVKECQAGLSVPLVLEFPGFSRGVSLVMGDLHAYDFFRVLAEETDAPTTLDVGHLLSYQWWRGRRDDALFDEIDRLPLDHCFEIHLSGCSIVDDRFVDAHHGVLLDEQMAMLERLVPRCPNLRAVTYEDPHITDDGELVSSNRPSWSRLVEVMRQWTKLHDSNNTIARAVGA